jgi:xanthine dehydrogenase YagS FAD-binding subunit
MRAFALHQPETLDEALTLLHRFGRTGRPLGGGTDLIPILRGAVAGAGMPAPTRLVDVSRVSGMSGIRINAQGAVIGAGTTLVEIIESAELRHGWPLLVDALAGVASPEIRAIATLGGNLNQRPRCWFFRGREFDCLKKGGDVCFAVDGYNRYHAIVGGHLCFIVHPSDAATALLALDARARLACVDGERWVPIAEYFVGPRENLLAETVLRDDELMVEVVIPPMPTGARSAWRKMTDKGQDNWDFTLLSVAAVVVADHGVWRGGRIILGGVAPVPYRARMLEETLAGKEVRAAVTEAMERFRTVLRPMRDNAYKIPLLEALIETTLADALE